MSNNKQSSVDFLLKELEEIGVLNIKNCHWSNEVDVKKAIEQAKEMHKEEIRVAYMEGAFEKMRHLDGKEFMMPTDYYNETFGGNND